YLYVVVDQQGIDVVLAIYAPDGKKMGEVDSPTGNEGPEPLAVISEAAGQYRIEVRSLDATSPTGHYLIKIAELKEATARDRDRVAADSIFREAELLKVGTEGEKRRGIEKYQQALSLYRRAGDRKSETMTLSNIGFIHNSLGEPQQALKWFNEALPISREIRSRVDEAAILNNIGLAYDRLGELQKALEYYNAALPIRREVGERQPEAITLNNIASVYYELGDTQKALEHFTEALLIYRATRDRYGEADALSNMGVVYNRMGELQKALDNYKESVSLRLAMGDRLGASVAFNNIGTAYDSLGDLERALENYNEALKILRAGGNRYGEAITLQNIGKTYRSMGELQKALEYFAHALTIKRAVGDRSGEAVTLNSIGKVYQSLGEIPRALENFNAALLISQNFNYRGAEADALQNIGIANNSAGETGKALQSLNGALQIRRAVGDRIGEADTLLGIARVEQKSGNLIQARQTIEQAIDIVESVRTQIDSQRLRTSYFATQQEFYQAQIDILMQLHQQNPLAAYDAAAFSASERARARSLLELLNEARIDIRQGVDSSLLAREHSLQQRLSAKAADQSNLLGRNHTPEQAEATAREIAAITAEYDDVEAQIRASSPRYAALTQPQPLNLKEIQRQVLDPETLLLEYSLGETVSYLFVVSDTSITSYQLPNRAVIEAATRLVRDLLTAPEHRPGDSWLSIQVRMASARKKYWPEAVALSRMLLGPAASQLGTKRLLIVADGALQYLPFGTLPLPETQGSGDIESEQQGNSKVSRKNGSSSRRPTVHLNATPSR
ncbi:MAG: tetratricopeptide repeat protein, partial [Blastocatellia bacterium]|nr:tetratricopeptide repeat protein [Blastocatellia bacterium]